MGEITRTITADKAGIIDALRREAELERQVGTHATTKRERRFHEGKAQGMEHAVRMLEDWNEVSS
jgi:hypothetical protein